MIIIMFSLFTGAYGSLKESLHLADECDLTSGSLDDLLLMGSRRDITGGEREGRKEGE